MPRPEALKKDYIKHRVDYLGALPISNRSTNLAALQRPLKDLYFRYREQRNVGQSNLPGTLEINDTGLRVQYIRELHKGVQEIFNPFATIAVWAAVKFVHKRDVVPLDGSVRHRFAFLPLISDPDSQDKHRLYHELDFHEVELAADAPHPPIFACVMRRTGVPKQLECHGFVSASAEDAIIVAANLYQALLETMKKQKARRQQRMHQQRQQQQRQRQRQREEEDEIEEDEEHDDFDEDAAPPPPSIFSDSDATASGTHPIRPPRRKKKSPKGSDAGGGYSGPSSLVSLGRRRSVRSSTRSNKSKRTVTYDPTRRSTRLGRTDSARKSMSRSELARKSARKSARTKEIPPYAQPHKNLMSSEAKGGKQGDLYTRVAIPRSKSFMNVNSQYNLQELFRELKEKEGVESIDDVLKKVISPNGISFNEIKPVYRELLLKLAMTMSQDELFARSKNIMSQEKKKVKKEDGKKGGKGSSSSNESGSSNTLSSFLKMTFSSSKTNSLSGKKKKADALGSLQNPKHKNNAILSPINSYSLQAPSSAKKVSSIPSSLGSSNDAKRILLTKADISGPLPINGTTKPALGSRTPAASRKTSKISPPPSSVDDAYQSCSECGGYESVCTYDDGNCSCRVPKIPPPKEYQAGPVHSARDGPFAAKPPSSPESGVDQDIESCIYSDCDHESCHSDEKCYCSLRGHPQDSHTMKRPSVLPEKGKVESTRLHVHHHQPRPPPPPPGPPPPVMRSKNNTTIIHCSGNSTISSTCSSCICGDDSGSTATDTTCYSIQRTNYAPPPPPNNDNSLLSGFESPQTAWRRNSRLAGGAASTSEQCYSCSDCGRAASRVAAEPDSGGSGYASNDSCPLHGGGGNVGNTISRRNPPPHSHRSRSHDVTSHVSSSHSSGCASCGGGGNGRGRQQQQHLNGKVLVLSGVDRSGKVSVEE